MRQTALALVFLFLLFPGLAASATPVDGEPGASGEAAQAAEPGSFARMLAALAAAGEAEPAGDAVPDSAPDGAPSPTRAADPSRQSALFAPDALAEALAAYEATGEAPILALPIEQSYPFGHDVPVLRCLPLRACDVELEAGEQVVGWALGDTERWLAEQLVEGAGPTARAHLLLKPVDFDLATNLVIVTDRRTYHLEVESPPETEVRDRQPGDPPPGYDGRVSWWYPDDYVRRVTDRRAVEETRREREAAERRGAVELQASFSPADLSFAYDVVEPWRRSRRLGWRPLTVFDDGKRVYVRLPERALRGELPVLLGVLADGDQVPLNAHLEGEWWVVPALFERAELVLGTGKARRWLRLVAQSEGR
jgi:type IV secretion system protein VirB9